MEETSEEGQGPTGAVEPVMILMMRRCRRRRRREEEDDKDSFFNISSIIT
jgi:hypothetical protein